MTIGSWAQTNFALRQSQAVGGYSTILQGPMASHCRMGCVAVTLLWSTVLGFPSLPLDSLSPLFRCFLASEKIYNSVVLLLDKHCNAHRRCVEELDGDILDGPVSTRIDSCDQDSLQMDPKYTKCLQNIQSILERNEKELNQLKQIEATLAVEIDKIVRDIKGLLSRVKTQLKVPQVRIARPVEVLQPVTSIRGNSWMSTMATLRVLKLSVIQAEAVDRSFGILVKFNSRQRSHKSLATETKTTRGQPTTEASTISKKFIDHRPHTHSDSGKD
ncbi:uncharacterized protein LOC133344969 [Lethenteron reissneri]|uniref:uncharacterized protein LOC133344969 n=1 Tax=Lethenteron reissneri TaxID=7753 RepID=UPI002AB73D06|nr:uncharacterized protein LOC133344969 [Lethenteron reissneri]